MVVASEECSVHQKILAVDQDIPTIDLSLERSDVSRQIVKACETIGFFKVINHGVDPETITRMEEESRNFFAKPVHEKQTVGPANPFGYGFRNIGFNGDSGEIEYLLLHTDPISISRISFSISSDPQKFSSAVNCYIEAVKRLACEILDLVAEGLRVPHNTFSRLIRAVDSDSILRLNHYPPSDHFFGGPSLSDSDRVGFGEHTDPQILTVLRSNGVSGLQVSLSDGIWVPVSPDPSAFCINVGDLLQAMTNGRLKSVKHRAMTTATGQRMSTAYFAGPPNHTPIKPPESIVSPEQPRLYRTFTWSDYKKAAYSLRLRDTRLNLFLIRTNALHPQLSS